MKRLLITGAAGGLGRVMREKLVGQAELLRLSDVADLGKAKPNEELVQCDLGDLDVLLDDFDGTLLEDQKPTGLRAGAEDCLASLVSGQRKGGDRLLDGGDVRNQRRGWPGALFRVFHL